MNAGEHLIDHAAGDLGRHESPPDSNWGPFVKPVLASAGVHEPEPWCCALATKWVNDVAAVDPRVFHVIATAGCGTLAAWAERKRVWLPVDERHVESGFLAIVKGFAHVVMIEGLHNGGLVTIAGNTSQANGSNYNGGNVARHTYTDWRDRFMGLVRTW